MCRYATTMKGNNKIVHRNLPENSVLRNQILQLFKKLQAFCGTRCFMTSLTNTHHSLEFSPNPHNYAQHLFEHSPHVCPSFDFVRFLSLL